MSFKIGDKVRVREATGQRNGTIASAGSDGASVALDESVRVRVYVRYDDLLHGWASEEKPGGVYARHLAALAADPQRRMRDELLARVFGPDQPESEPKPAEPLVDSSGAERHFYEIPLAQLVEGDVVELLPKSDEERDRNYIGAEYILGPGRFFLVQFIGQATPGTPLTSLSVAPGSSGMHSRNAAAAQRPQDGWSWATDGSDVRCWRRSVPA